MTNADDPLVSIVLPVYNGEQFISRSVDSCLNQTHSNTQLIIVNDASTDRTPDILSAYSEPRITIINNETNQGLPRSLNIGFAASSGSYLTWTSADNYYAPHAIEALVQELKSARDIGLVYGSFYLVDEKNNIIGRKVCPPPVYLTRENTVGAYFMYRREVFKRVGDYDPEMRLAEDYDYWLRIYRQYKVRIVDQDGYYYRVHSGSLTGTSQRDEVTSVTNLARRRSCTCLGYVKCSVYSAVDPIAAHMSQSQAGRLLKRLASGLWRHWGGR